MDEAGELLSLVSSGVSDEALLVELGRVVASSTVLEFTIAVLVALTEGKRGRSVDDRALQIVERAGGARGRLKQLGEARPVVRWLCCDSYQLLEARNILVHALVTGRGREKGEYVQAIYSARHDTVEYVTAAVVARHARFFEENASRFREAITAELAGQLTGASPGCPPRPTYGGNRRG